MNWMMFLGNLYFPIACTCGSYYKLHTDQLEGCHFQQEYTADYTALSTKGGFQNTILSILPTVS